MIRIIGPRDKRETSDTTKVVINTTSRSTDNGVQFSPFKLGPVRLYGGQSCRIMENAWQFCKVYPAHQDSQGNPSSDYFAWAARGWSRQTPVRYPMGKGVKPAYLYWDGERLDYIEARKRVYLPLYRDAVKATPAFAKLLKIHAQGRREIVLWDFDGYDHRAQGMSLWDVINNPKRSLGHAFVLLMMLTYGPDVTADDLRRGQSQEKALPGAYHLDDDCQRALTLS